MGTFKSEIFAICNDVANEFEDWNFISGAFKNKSLRHTALIIRPGFSFRLDATPFQPSVQVWHKSSMALFTKITGYELATSMILFQKIAPSLEYIPEKLRCGVWILRNKELYTTIALPSERSEERMIDITEARSILRSMMKEGISIIEKYYDLSSEENFLWNLPPKYITRDSKTPYDELDMQKGVMMCIVHILLGDFDFIERYRSDNFNTIYPKRISDLDKIIAVLPELKKQYAKTGKVI